MPTTPAALGKPIGRGHTAEIFAWSDTQVLKLFFPTASERTVQYEAEIARKVHAAGVRVPAVYDLVALEGRFGIVYERIVGTSLLQRLQRQPWRIVQSAQTWAELHVDIHQHMVPTLPLTTERLRMKIEQAQGLAPDLRERILAALHSLPSANRLCHGDFHPDNILMTRKGPIIIDWNDATQGHPLGDVARSLVLARFSPSGATGMARRMETLLRWLLRSLYLRRYRQLQPFATAELERWLAPNIAARLSENVDEVAPALLQALQKL